MSDRVLTDDELSALLLVPTTVEQATQIKERNERLMEALDDGREESYEGVIGCPHCSPAMRCGKCSWIKYPHEDVALFCLEASFGGVSYFDTMVDYSALSEAFSQHDGDPVQVHDATRTFLLGHIEWADEVIKRGGTA